MHRDSRWKRESRYDVSVTKRKYFGTDGIRGVANVPPMTSDTVMRLGMAIAARLRQDGRKPRIVIGKDTRLSGYLFETAMATGIVSMGADVWITGPLPTPGIAFITASMRGDAGVVISASHNPYQDNGIKLFTRSGYKLDDSVELEIEALMDSPDLLGMRARPEDVGYTRRIEHARGRYVVHCKGTFPPTMTLDGLTIVVDAAHGAGYRVAPAVFTELGANVITLHNEPNGRNINDHAGATAPEAMCAKVKEVGAHVGVALDGDADRLVLCDHHGNVVDGDAVMALCATRMIKSGELAKNTLVTTVMSNIGLERCIEEAGGTLLRTSVGDRYVVEAMKNGGYNFGGEQSGHLVFLEYMTTGDGLIAALRVLAIMVEEGKPLAELTNVMTRTPQVLVNTKVDKKVPLDELPTVQAMIAKVEADLGDDGRVLVRYSGTENKARVMIEGPDQDSIKTRAEEIAAEMAARCK